MTRSNLIRVPEEGMKPSLFNRLATGAAGVAVAVGLSGMFVYAVVTSDDQAIKDKEAVSAIACRTANVVLPKSLELKCQ